MQSGRLRHGWRPPAHLRLLGAEPPRRPAAADPRRPGTYRAMLAAARFAQGAVAHAFADPAAARVALLDAVALFAAVDAPYERARPSCCWPGVWPAPSGQRPPPPGRRGAPHRPGSGRPIGGPPGAGPPGR